MLSEDLKVIVALCDYFFPIHVTIIIYLLGDKTSSVNDFYIKFMKLKKKKNFFQQREMFQNMA